MKKNLVYLCFFPTRSKDKNKNKKIHEIHRSGPQRFDIFLLFVHLTSTCSSRASLISFETSVFAHFIFFCRWNDEEEKKV